MGLLQQKSRQSKIVVIMQSNLLITDTATLLGAALCSSRCNNYKNTCQLWFCLCFTLKWRSVGFIHKWRHFEGFSGTLLLLLSAGKPQILSDWSTGVKQFAYVHNTRRTWKWKLLMVTFMLKGKLAQTKSPCSLSHIHYIHFHDEPTLTFWLLFFLTPIIWVSQWRVFLCASVGLAAFSTSATKQQKETCLGVINPRLFGLLTLTFPHISLPLFFFFVNPYCSHSLRLADTLTAVC